ncbi:hypothetical protein AVEN_254929-1, partial [Araneus ventricosus]
MGFQKHAKEDLCKGILAYLHVVQAVLPDLLSDSAGGGEVVQDEDVGGEEDHVLLAAAHGELHKAGQS